MTAAETLERAAEIIEELGWCQHDYTDGHGVCVVGALNVASHGDPYNCATWEGYRVGCEAMKILQQHMNAIPSLWNDSRGRTKEEVIRMLRGAAAKATDQPRVPDPAIEQINESLEAVAV